MFFHLQAACNQTLCSTDLQLNRLKNKLKRGSRRRRGSSDERRTQREREREREREKGVCEGEGALRRCVEHAPSVGDLAFAREAKFRLPKKSFRRKYFILLIYVKVVLVVVVVVAVVIVKVFVNM